MDENEMTFLSQSFPLSIVNENDDGDEMIIK